MTTPWTGVDDAWRDSWWQLLERKEKVATPMRSCQDQPLDQKKGYLGVAHRSSTAVHTHSPLPHAPSLLKPPEHREKLDGSTWSSPSQCDGDQTTPAPYGSTPPSYEDALHDAPPDYTHTDELARPCASSPSDLAASPPPPPYTPSASPLDWTSSDGFRQHTSNKKKKQAAKKAQAAKWADSDNEGNKEDGDGANGDGGNNNGGGDDAAGAGGAGGGGDDGEGGGDDGNGGKDNNNNNNNNNDDGAGGGKKKKKDKKKNRWAAWDEEEDEQAKANKEGAEGDAGNHANGEDANAVNGADAAAPAVTVVAEANPDDEWDVQPKKGKKGKKGKAQEPMPPPPPPAPSAPPEPDPQPGIATTTDGFDDIGLDDNAPKIDLSFSGGGSSTWGQSWGNTTSKWGFGSIGSALTQDKDKDKEKDKEKETKSSNPWSFAGLGKKDKKNTADTGFAAFDFGLSGSANDAQGAGEDDAGADIAGMQSTLHDVNGGAEWSGFTTAAGKKDKKKKKGGAAPVEPEPTAAPAIEVVNALTTDDALPAPWASTKKKDKKGKRDSIEPKIEEDPIAIVAPSAAAEVATTVADDEWMSFGSGKKNKKNKKNANADAAGGLPPPPPPPPEPSVPDIADDGKSTDGLSIWSTKSDKKKKKGGKSSAAAETETTGAKTNGITLVDDATLDINNDALNNNSLLDGDDWGSWALSSKDQPKLGGKSGADTVESMFESLDNGVDTTSSWNIWPSAKKDKKGKNANGGLEPPPPVPTPPKQGLTPGSTPPPPPAPIDAAAPTEAGEDEWASFAPVTKGKKGSKKSTKADAASKTASNSKGILGNDDIVAVIEDPKPEKDNEIVAIIDEAQRDAEWPDDDLDEPGAKSFWSGFGTSSSKSKKEKQKEEKERLKKEKEEKLKKEKEEEEEKAKREQEEQEEQERQERERAEQAEREKAEKEEKEREEKSRKAKEKEDREKAKKDREEREKAKREEAKREREEKERAKKEKEEKEKAKREEAKREREEKERARKEEAKREKEEKEKAEKERKERERQEQEEKERLEKEEREQKRKDKAKGKAGKKSKETIEEPEPDQDAAAAAAAMLISELDGPTLDDHVIGDWNDDVPDADVKPKADKAKDKEKEKEKEKEKDSIWGFWGTSRKSKATPATARDKALSQPANEPEATRTATDEAAAQAANIPPEGHPADTSTTPAASTNNTTGATREKKRSSIADKIKAFEQPSEPAATETRKGKGASQRSPWATSKLGSSKPGLKQEEREAEAAKKEKEKEREPERPAPPVEASDTVVPGSFPTDAADDNDLIAIIDEAPPPERKPSKSKKKKGAKVAKMDTLDEIVDMPLDDTPPPPPPAPAEPPTPPPEPTAPEPAPAPKPVKKERARVVREESSWGFWGTTKQRDPKAKERKPKDDPATPASPPKESAPALETSRSGRKEAPKDDGSPAQSSSSDKEKSKAVRPEKRPSRSKGITLAGFLSGTAPPPRRTTSRREASAPKVDARPKEVELNDHGLLSPPPEDEPVRAQSSAKAAKILGTSEKTAAKLARRESTKRKGKGPGKLTGPSESSRRRTTSLTPSPAVEAALPPAVDDDVVVIDDGDDLLGDYGATNAPPPAVVFDDPAPGRSRDKGKVSRLLNALEGSADRREHLRQKPMTAANAVPQGPDDLVMVDAPGPSDSGPEQATQRSADRMVPDRPRARNSPLKRASTGTKKTEGLMGFFGSLRSKARAPEVAPRRRKSGSDERPSGYGSRGARLSGSDGDGGRVRRSSKRDSQGSGTGTERRSRTDNSGDGEEAEARRAERRARRAARESAEREAREARAAELREAEERRARRKAAEREANEARRQKAREAKERQAREEEERAYRRQKERSAKRAREEEARREAEARDVRRRVSGRTKRREADVDSPREGPSRPRRTERRSSGNDRGVARGSDEDERRRARREDRRTRRGDDRVRPERRRSGPAAVGRGDPIQDYFDPRNARQHGDPYMNGPQEPGTDHTSSWVNSQMAEPAPPPPVEPTVVEAPVGNGEPSQPRDVGGADGPDDGGHREARRSARRSSRQVDGNFTEPEAGEAGRSSRRRKEGRRTDREGRRSSEGSDEYANATSKRRRASRRVTTGGFPSTMATGGVVRTFDGRPTSGGDKRGGSWWKGLGARIAGV